MDKYYILTEEDYGTLKEMAAAYRSGELGRPRIGRRTSSRHFLSYIGYTDPAGLSAMTSSDATPGSGSVTLYEFTTAGAIQAVSNSCGEDATITVYNLSDDAVAGNTYVQVKTEAMTGKYIVDYERC